MAIINATENPPLATAVRGYDRAAVDEVIARETSQLRTLESRAAALERELATPPPTSGGVPLPRQKVQQALDVIGAGWDEAILVTASAEHAAALDRSHAQHRVSAAMATLEEQCREAERAADETAQRMVASATEQAARLLEHAASEHDRAVEGAAAMARAAEDRAMAVAAQFAAKLLDAEEQQAERIATRFADADKDVTAAQAELAAAERDAAQIAERARVAREEIIAQGRAAAEEVLVAAGAEVRRRQAEIEDALAELGRLMIALGGQLVGAPIPHPAGQPQVTRSVAS